MQRYFFDLVDQGRSEFDFRGREMQSVVQAKGLAELIAIDESARGDRIGWHVKVLDARGKVYFSIPINDLPELAAA